MSRWSLLAFTLCACSTAAPTGSPPASPDIAPSADAAAAPSSEPAADASRCRMVIAITGMT